MQLVQKILFYCISVIIIILILALVRKKRIREIDSWLWLVFALFLVVLISNISMLEKLAYHLHVAKSIVIIFLSSIAFLILILQLYMTAASYNTKIKNLSQKIALLEEKIERLENKENVKKQPAGKNYARKNKKVLS